MLIYIRKKHIIITAVTLAVLMAVSLVAFALQPKVQAVQSYSWGLHFEKKNQIPIPNLSDEVLNPYNALFKDDKGYYAVIDGNKFSDVRRPVGFNFNQMRKVVKETFDVYAEDYRSKFSNEKELISFMNGFKAEINKADFSDPILIMTEFEEKFFAFLEKKGVSKPSFDGYLNQKGLRIIKQGNFYFRKKEYENFAKYKKIEFRYW